MLYAEHGKGAGKDWDRESSQATFGNELETIIQRGTKFLITKVEKSSKGIFIDMGVLDQIKE